MEPTTKSTVTETQREKVERLFRRAKEKRSGNWESHWQECYEYALPQRDGGLGKTLTPGAKRLDKVFDGTAPDAVDQLASSLMAQLTPPWAKWFQGEFTDAVDQDTATAAAPALQRATAELMALFDRSNFSVEIHQCYLDLVVAGTASLSVERAEDGSRAPFRFTALPLSSVYLLEDDVTGELNHTFHVRTLSLGGIERLWPTATIPAEWRRDNAAATDKLFTVLESEIPNHEDGGFDVMVTAAASIDALCGLPATGPTSMGQTVLDSGRRGVGRFINFRWLKAPGEIYGRSPVMKALPDIKTANKVVELVLKNASIAVTGIWQADDDGVLNPATVRLVPGAIIPKAMGSSGLTPLEAPGRFDVSQLILEDLRSRIRKSLLADQLGQINGPRMTATEVLERSAEMARVLGATYGRLQQEMLVPVIGRAFLLAAKAGALKTVAELVRQVSLDQIRVGYLSAMAKNQRIEDVRNVSVWLDGINNGLGPSGQSAVNPTATARWLGTSLGVPAELMLDDDTIAENAQAARETGAEDLAAAEGIKADAKATAAAPPPVDDGMGYVQ